MEYQPVVGRGYDILGHHIAALMQEGIRAGGAGQFEIEPKLGEMSKMADATMLIKYIIHNTALKYGKSATFMPKPVYGEAGSGMHVHMLLLKDGEPVFSDDNGYSHLSREAHWFMGGLLKHIHSLCAITNPSTNSFKRLVPGFEGARHRRIRHEQPQRGHPHPRLRQDAEYAPL